MESKYQKVGTIDLTPLLGIRGGQLYMHAITLEDGPIVLPREFAAYSDYICSPIRRQIGDGICDHVSIHIERRESWGWERVRDLVWNRYTYSMYYYSIPANIPAKVSVEVEEPVQLQMWSLLGPLLQSL